MQSLAQPGVFGTIRIPKLNPCPRGCLRQDAVDQQLTRRRNDGAVFLHSLIEDVVLLHRQGYGHRALEVLLQLLTFLLLRLDNLIVDRLALQALNLAEKQGDLLHLLFGLRALENGQHGASHGRQTDDQDDNQHQFRFKERHHVSSASGLELPIAASRGSG